MTPHPTANPFTPTQVGAPSLGEPHWHSRGYLPHLDQLGLIQSITFRLHDALPKSKLTEWEWELALSHVLPTERERLLRSRCEKYLDAGHGSCWLRDPKVGSLVEEGLLHFDGQHYKLLAWCVMPNHVHVLVETRKDCSLAKMVQSWKGRTARAANQHLRRTGPFWQREYFDRFIRDEAHYANVLRYIHENPVKARLVRTAQDWPLGSARHTGSADFSRPVGRP